MEALLDVWESSQCRIDNSLDTRHAPFPKEEIKKRALDLAVGREDYPPYNLADNNCEHFASWVRNGVKISKQVVKTGTEILNVKALENNEIPTFKLTLCNRVQRF